MANFKIIKELCYDRKISLKHLAEAVGLSEHGIQFVMKNNSTNTTTLEKIAKYLGVPVGIFFDEDVSKTTKNNVINGDGNFQGNNGVVGNFGVGLKPKKDDKLGEELERVKKENESLEKQNERLEKMLERMDELLKKTDRKD